MQRFAVIRTATAMIVAAGACNRTLELVTPIAVATARAIRVLMTMLEKDGGPHGLMEASISRRRMALIRDW